MTIPAAGILFREVEVRGRIVDVRTRGPRVVEIGERLDPRGGGGTRSEDLFECGGAALLPGLHDHHLHLHAMAAARQSVAVGPPAVTDRDGLVAALRAAASSAAPGDWIRAVDYHESVAGPLDRDFLDGLRLGVPVRVQHRSGALWVLDSAALHHVGQRIPLDSEDVERDPAGVPNGRLWRFDSRLRPGLPATDGRRHRDALGRVRDTLLSHGITGVTDATPDTDAAAIAELAAVRPLHVHVLGAPADLPLGRGQSRGPRKLLLRDHDLPAFDELCRTIDPGALGPRRAPVAVHCVTRESLVLTLAALRECGPRRGDRIEHASVAPADLDPLLVEAGVTVVTQPDFLRTRGDQYLASVDPDDLGCLYRWATLESAGVPVAASSDAPYGDPDPWTVLRTAAARRTEAGVVLGADDRVPASRALDSILRPLAGPGAAPRAVEVGAPATVCLLDRPLADALEPGGGSPVRLTVVDGAVVWSR
ncbi:amidohydrolase family protein [Dietzia aurantiaca]|uniref:Amidohydrolase family protein n=1 Tax=Dietzia aurantiaca TaxID=983873 RepID=A0ABV9PPG0_9ACTN